MLLLLQALAFLLCVPAAPHAKPSATKPQPPKRRQGRRRKVTDYCIIGAGPAGLQMAHFMQQAGMQYIVFEQNSVPGSFFLKYPRHRKLISINKRHTGREGQSPGGKDFNLRHDWHSLLSDDDSLLMKHFSKKFFPEADEYLNYIKAFVNKTKPLIKYDHKVIGMREMKLEGGGDGYKIIIEHLGAKKKEYCRRLLLATGMHKENVPNWQGIELTESYGEYEIDPSLYSNKSVGVIGAGNSAYEVLGSLMDEAAFVFQFGENKRLAWETHYPGDLRSVNTVPFDNYQLKSLDVLFVKPFELEHLGFREEVDGERKVCLVNSGMEKEMATKVLSEWGNKVAPDHTLTNRERFENRQRHCFDHIIRCTGFSFDTSVLGKLAGSLPLDHGRDHKKFPIIWPYFESTRFGHMFFLGVNAHSIDYKVSSGGFLHGFRYMIRNLFNFLRWRYHDIKWPHSRLTLGEDLREKLTHRMDTSSALYQMFSVLCDVAVITSRDGEATVDYFYEVVMVDVADFIERTYGEGVRYEYLTLTMEYAPEFHGERVWEHRDYNDNDPGKAHTTQFIHPVVRYFNPKAESGGQRPEEPHVRVKDPEPFAVLYMLENLRFDYTNYVLHVRPLEKFLERIRQHPPSVPDESLFTAESCTSTFEGENPGS